MAMVILRYWAAAKEAAGGAEQVVTADNPAAALAQAGSGAVWARLAPVGEGAVIEVVPPLAGRRQ